MAVDAGWSRARNVLCVRLDTLGDVLMTTPGNPRAQRIGPPAGASRC